MSVSDVDISTLPSFSDKSARTGWNCYLSSLDLITYDLQALNRDTHLVVNLLDEFFPDQLYPADKHFPGSIPFILVAGSCKQNK